MYKKLIFIVALVLFLGVCSAVFSEPVFCTAPQGSIVVIQGVDTTAVDPRVIDEMPAFNLLINVFDPLVKLDHDTMEPKAHLAESYEIIDDYTWQFNLRKNVKFHNGELFDAKSVKATFDWVLDPANKSPFSIYLAPITEVKIIDDFTVQILTDEPFPVLPLELVYLHMCPAGYIAEYGDEHFAKNPVGTGAYKFVEWRKDERVVLEAFEDYWQGTPNIKEVIFKPVPELSSRLIQLSTGEADIVTGISPDIAHMVENVGQLKVVQSPRSIYAVLDTLEEGPLQDRRVRQALNYAVDVDTIIETVLEGFAFRRAIPGTPYHFGFDDSIEPYEYNPTKARQLLAEAGYPDGFSIVFNSPSGRYLKDVEVVEAISGYLQEVGIDVEIRVHEWAHYSQLTNNRAAGPVFLFGWAGTLDMDGTLYSLLYSGSRYSVWSNSAFDEMILEARQIVDPIKRKQIYQETLSFVYEEAPYIFLYNQATLYGLSNRVEYEPRVDELLDIFTARLK